MKQNVVVKCTSYYFVHSTLTASSYYSIENFRPSLGSHKFVLIKKSVPQEISYWGSKT